MIRGLSIALLAVLVTGCASQNLPVINQVDNTPVAVSSTPPANPVSPPSPAPGVELLGEISSSTTSAPPPSRPCDLDNCGVIVAITHHKGKERLPPGQAPGAAEGPGVYYISEVGLETTVTRITELWEIRVRMRSGNFRVFQQDFQPFLEVGNPVLVDGNNLQLWN